MTAKRITRVEEIENDWMKLERAFPGIVKRALENVVEDTIMAESAGEVPVRTGQLRRSGTVEDATFGKGRISITFGYNTEYAVRVHEDLKMRHKPPTKAKYLEDPVKRHIPDLAQKVLAEVNRLLGVA